MKKLSILFFLPLFVCGQQMNLAENDLAFVDFKMKIGVQLELENKLYNHEFNDHRPTVLANLKMPVTPEEDNTAPSNTTYKNIPKHLNTYTISRLPGTEQGLFAPQERLDSLLALNDLEFPKEDTLLISLNAVRYNTSSLGGPENMPEGFGPKIKL